MQISVAIVEDNNGMRRKFAALLDQTPGMRCVGAYATGEEAVREMPNVKPDVALVDIHLPAMDGIQVVSKLKESMEQLQILMLTRFEQSDLIFNSIRAGACGYLLKSATSSELIDAIKQIHAGGAPMSMQIARKVVAHFREIPKPASEVERLSAREQELLELLANGCFYKEIADKLGISMNTVRTHVKHVYEKLHVKSRTQAVVKFLNQR